MSFRFSPFGESFLGFFYVAWENFWAVFFDVLLAWERHDFRSLMTVNGDFESLILDSVEGSFWSLILYTTLSMNATPKPMNNT